MLCFKRSFFIIETLGLFLARGYCTYMRTGKRAYLQCCLVFKAAVVHVQISGGHGDLVTVFNY